MYQFYRKIRSRFTSLRLWFRRVRAEHENRRKHPGFSYYARLLLFKEGIEILAAASQRFSIWFKERLGFLEPYPRTIRMKTFVPAGCRFRIHNQVESARIERYGNEKKFTQLILDELHPGDTLFDVGACLGLISINAAVKGADVFAFEPEPSYRRRLHENLRLNELQNVTVLEWAVSDQEGSVDLFTDGPIGGFSPSLRKIDRLGESVTVETKAIDSAIRGGEIPPPDVIKIDIEGAEMLALRGMRNLLGSADAPRAIFIEIHPEHLESFDSSEDEVVSLIESSGYRQAHREPRTRQVHCVFARDKE